MYDLDSLKYWTLEQMCSKDFESFTYSEIEMILDNLIKKAIVAGKSMGFEDGYQKGFDAAYDC